PVCQVIFPPSALDEHIGVYSQMLLISSGVGHSGLPVLFGLKPDRLAHERSFFLTGVISTAFSSCSTSTTVPSLSPNFALNSLGMRTRPRSSMVDCMLFPIYIVGRYLNTRCIPAKPINHGSSARTSSRTPPGDDA